MFFRRLFILFTLCSFAVGLIAFLVRPAQAAEDVCFAEYSGDGVTDFSSADASALRSAIFALPNGGVVKVAGTCAGTFDYGHEVKQVALVGLPLTLVGGYTITNWLTPDVASNVTVLDAQGDGRVLWAIAPITLSGLTLTGGNSGLDGGGALFQSAAIVADSTFTQNTTSGSGGGALFQSRAVLTNTVFSRNLATLSGGGALFAGETALTNTTFFSNTASGLGSGGAIFNGATTVANSAFIQNQGDSGGATFNNTATVASTIFRQNSGAYGGGASFNWFQGQEQHRLLNVLFAGNSANINGQAIYVQNTALLELIQTTIVSPTLVTGAPAIFLSQGTAALTNTIVASHTNGLENFGGVLSEDFNLFSDVTTPYAGTINSGGNSITGTVAFANPTDYTLTPASAAVDTGTNAGVNRDFFGTVRPQGAGFEIGYAEFTPPPPSVCFATTDNGVTLFAGPNASALRSAIAAASDGGMVKVAGTCAGAIAKDGTVQVALITQTLTLAGGYTTTNWLTPNVTSNVTVLDAQGAGRVIFATAPLTVSGLTLMGGNSDEDEEGGGAYFASSAAVANATFAQNTSGYRGGGAYFASSATVTNTTFAQNTSGFRGGGGAVFASSATVVNTTFTLNTSIGEGGGAYFDGSATLVNTTFAQNTGDDGGGAIFFDSAAVTNTIFTQNIGEQGGGAVFGVFGHVTTIANSTFTLNIGEAVGGAYFDGPTTMANTTFAQNFTVATGGGAWFTRSATVTNTAFIQNTSGFVGGGAVFYGSTAITNSTFTENVAGEAGGGAVFGGPATVANTTFTQNTASGSLGDGGDGGGAVFSDLATVTNSAFTQNIGGRSGGGAVFGGPATIANTTFTQNTASASLGEGGDGGGAVFGGLATITNSTFTQNTGRRHGGGAYFAGPNQFRLTNVLIANNTAGNGQAIYVFDTALLELIHATIVSPTLVTGPAVYVNSGTVALTNTFVASHTVGLENAGGSVSENFNLFGNVTVPYSGTIISGGNSITGTAAFANYTDYTLTQAGAAIDKGTNAGVNRDFFGIARPQGAGFDIGYAEFVPIIFKLYLPIIGR